MANDYTAKRISELQEATKVTDRDLLVLNEFSSETGYTLTKKVLASKLAEYVRLRSTGGITESLDLSDLAHYDVDKLLNELMSRGHYPVVATDSLALSTLADLHLGEMAGMNVESLQLDNYVKKHDAIASFTAGPRQYINGIAQRDGVITNVSLADLDDKIPVDSSIIEGSNNPVTGGAVKITLDKKVDKSYASVDDSPVNSCYVDSVSLKDGKISVHKSLLPKQIIDDALNTQSTNAVQNKVITAKLTSLNNEIRSDSDSTYVKKSEANATWTAGSNQYIYKVQLTDGRLVDVLYRSLPDNVIIDAAMSTTSTNAVLNKVITAKIQDINLTLDNFVKKTEATGNISAPDGYYIKGITLTNGKITNISYALIPSNNFSFLNPADLYFNAKVALNTNYYISKNSHVIVYVLPNGRGVISSVQVQMQPVNTNSFYYLASMHTGDGTWAGDNLSFLAKAGSYLRFALEERQNPPDIYLKFFGLY